MTLDVLVVDDDPRILATFRRAAAAVPGVTLRYALTVREANERLKEQAPSVLICDDRLPDGDGLTLLQRVGERFPGVKRVLHTGEAVQRVSFGFDVPVLGKPTAPGALKELLEAFTRDGV